MLAGMSTRQCWTTSCSLLLLIATLLAMHCVGRWVWQWMRLNKDDEQPTVDVWRCRAVKRCRRIQENSANNYSKHTHLATVRRDYSHSIQAVDFYSVAVLGLSVWGPRFWVGGIQSEQLHVSYYELYYASLWFWCLESNSSKNTQNMHAKKSIVQEF